MSDVGTALILGWGPGLGGDGLLLEDDMRNPIQGEHGLSVNGVLLPADDHLAVLNEKDWVALVFVLVVDRCLGLGVGELLLHDDIYRPMQGRVVLGVDEPLLEKKVTCCLWRSPR